MIEFQQLLTLADDVKLSCISTAEGVRNYLSTRPEVLALRRALVTGAVTFKDVEGFVRELTEHFVRGSRNPEDSVLAAVVLAVEPLPPAAIEAFLEDLARVKVAELPISPRVARLSLRSRATRLTRLTIRNLDIAEPVPYPEGPRERRPFRIEVGVNYRELDLRVA